VADCFAPPKAKLIGLFHWVASGNRQERDRERALKDGYFHLSFCLIPIMETKERERERERERDKREENGTTWTWNVNTKTCYLI
jgi:hypothetical protein